ncbi:hypothetical protein QAD02_022815 [Eretmocerus hayati]|uniref:Uncharacterized protein n=1 Tax=Eretmocerus hayati TaxID=131215 RepID=A0ACC2PU17_9HYME|nr:hypothetical protein QAD02_022815 [Eretmocerus hayati]
MTRISGSSLKPFLSLTYFLAQTVFVVLLVVVLDVYGFENGQERITTTLKRRIGDKGDTGPPQFSIEAAPLLTPLWTVQAPAESRKVADQRIERNVTSANETNNTGFMPSFHLGPIGTLSVPPIDLDKQQSGLFNVDPPQLANARNRSGSPFNSVRTIKFENGSDNVKLVQEPKAQSAFRPSQKVENFVRPIDDATKQNVRQPQVNGNVKGEKAFDINNRNNVASEHVVDQALVGQQRNKLVTHYAFDDYGNNHQQYSNYEIRPAKVHEINVHPPPHHESAILPVIQSHHLQHQPSHIQPSAYVDEKIVRPEMVINVHPISYQATTLDSFEKPKTVIYVTSHDMAKAQQLNYDYYQPSVYDHQETPYILPEHVDYNHYEQQYPLLYEHHARSVSPWKKILHLVGAFLPLGLLFALLSPKVVNTSQTEPNIVLSKLRGNDLSAEHKNHQRPDGSSSISSSISSDEELTGIYNSEDTCEETSICRLIATADSSGAKLLQQLLRHVVDRTTESVVRKKELDKIFDAAKMGNCDVLTCNFYDVGYGVDPVHLTEFPFIVALALKKDTNEIEKLQFCGGTLISTRHVITMKHCLTDKLEEHVQVLTGSSDLTSASIRRFDVKKWIMYETWALVRDEAKKGAIDTPAIVVLKNHITSVTPVVRSKEKPSKLSGLKVTMAGWGSLDTGLRPTIMRKVALKVLSKEKCKQRMAKFLQCLRKIVGNDSIICTAAKPHALGGNGDSGDPILDEKQQLVGVHIGLCPDFDSPHPKQINSGISIYYYKDFIDEVMMLYM